MPGRDHQAAGQGLGAKRRLANALRDGRPRAGWFLLAAALALLLVLLAEGARPGGTLPAPRIPHVDKVLHFCAHGLITSLMVWGLALLRPARAKRVALVSLVLDTLFGIAVELAQKWLGAAHGRRFDWWDVAANSAGALLACALFLMVAAHVARPYTGPE